MTATEAWEWLATRKLNEHKDGCSCIVWVGSETCSCKRDKRLLEPRKEEG